MAIHETAVIEAGAELGGDVEVGPYAIVHDRVRIGDGTRIGPYCVIKPYVTLGKGNTLDVGVVLGSDPQDAKFDGEESFVEIGDNNILREYVTIHRATGAGKRTIVGDDNFLMAYSHLGHNVRMGSDIMIASFSGISGHCVIHDGVVIGGFTGLHQYVTIGRMCMIGGQSRVTRDIPPFTTALGNELQGINAIGLARHDVAEDDQAALRQAFRTIYRSDQNTSDAIASLRQQGPLTEMVREFVEFIERIDEGRRGRQEN
ncbi:MAG: acyl-ACP--UDP-N-acetylglucosamine O-acyltransferase [Armatimonadota bacterium]|nr:acyl-ACP--UDP-N-acetylglucosamine O-acyltransferase [Armatimonadota bacterium]